MHLTVSNQDMNRLLELHDIHRNAHNAMRNAEACKIVQELAKKAIADVVTSSPEWKQFIADDAGFLIKDMTIENLEVTVTVVFDDRPCFDCSALIVEDRLPCRSSIGRLPHAARRSCSIHELPKSLADS